jgi:hypothetical protein
MSGGNYAVSGNLQESIDSRVSRVATERAQLVDALAEEIAITEGRLTQLRDMRAALMSEVPEAKCDTGPQPVRRAW